MSHGSILLIEPPEDDRHVYVDSLRDNGFAVREVESTDAGLVAAQENRSRYLADTLFRAGEITAADVAHGAQLGDAECAELIARCGRLVGESLAPAVNLLTPSLIVLGGVFAAIWFFMAGKDRGDD